MSAFKTSMTTGYLGKLIAEMEGRLGCKIDVVEDVNLNYPSKIEYARNYARQSHVLRVNPKRCINPYPVFYVLLNTKLQLRETPSRARPPAQSWTLQPMPPRATHEAATIAMPLKV